jgi:site-specific DNA-methyltransferase (adenine-specific)
MKYKQERKVDFQKICSALNGNNTFVVEDHAVVCEGNSLNALKLIPDNSVSLILTDPPYHSTKKKNIAGDTDFSCDNDFLNWIREYATEWHRILRPNGSLYMYCSSQMASYLEVMLSETFNILSNIVWTKPNEPGFDGWKQKMKKESLRQWYPHTERIIFCAPATKNSNLHRSYFADFLKETRKKAGLSGHELTELTGAYGKVNHGGAVSNWETGRNIPSREQYDKICKAFLDTGNIHKMPCYEDVIRAFNVNGEIEFTDVWNFPSVRPYQGKHPAEKPLDMLKHIIQSSSFDDDIVLDCFAGSGSTAIASLLLKRRTIALELESQHCKNIINRIKSIVESPDDFCMKKSIKAVEVDEEPQLQLV